MDFCRIKKITDRILKGSIAKTTTGINIYTPDGKASYNALWTRDLAYMLEYSGDLFPILDAEDCIKYLLDHADTDGWIPDRVDANGEVWYTAGDRNFPAKRNLDTAPFIIIAVDCYLSCVEDEKAKDFFIRYKDTLCKGMDIIPVGENGIVYNNPKEPHSPYGFTDTICKTGYLSIETLIVYRALRILGKLLEKYEFDNTKYINWCELIENSFLDIFSTENGMLLAATEDCRRTDIWASCYAVSTNFPMPKAQKEAIAKWLSDNYNDIVMHGQIRHLPKGVYWDKTFIEVKEEEYQNGAFWATATGWFYDALVEYDEKLAANTLKDAVNYFNSTGVFECINHNYQKLDTYVVSATNVYYACKKLQAKEQH